MIYDDLAVCLCIFNPTKSVNIYNNFLKICGQLEEDKVPVFIIEMIFEGDAPYTTQCPNTVHVYSKSYMFQKEKLYRVLEKSIPKEYTKLLFLDADILFERPDWYDKISEALNEYDVVQPFNRAKYMGKDNIDIVLVKSSFIKNKGFGNCHQGFAWAMRRAYYNEVGFFDYSFIGGGDSYSASFFINKPFSDDIKCPMYKIQRDKYLEYIKNRPPKVSYCSQSIFHLYHGDIQNRQYAERKKLFENVVGTFDDLIYENEYGIFEWKDRETWNPKILEYFKNRKDDD